MDIDKVITVTEDLYEAVENLNGLEDEERNDILLKLRDVSDQLTELAENGIGYDTSDDEIPDDDNN